MTYFNMTVRFLIVHKTIVKYKLSNADEIYRSLMEYETTVENSDYD